MFLETPREKSTVPPVCRRGHLGLGAHICCIRLPRGTGPFMFTKECIRLPYSGHLHTGEVKNPGTVHSARLVLKDRGIPGAPLIFKCIGQRSWVLMSVKSGGSSRADALSIRACIQTEAVPLFSWNSISELLLESTALERLLSSVGPSRACPHRPTQRQGPWLLPNPIKMTTKINPHICETLCHLPYCWDTHTGMSRRKSKLLCESLTEGSTQAEAGSKRPRMCCRVALIT